MPLVPLLISARETEVLGNHEPADEVHRPPWPSVPHVLYPALIFHERLTLFICGISLEVHDLDAFC